MGRWDKVSKSQVKMAELGAVCGTVRQAMHDELRKDFA
jgi:hypothetical protein